MSAAHLELFVIERDTQLVSRIEAITAGSAVPPVRIRQFDSLTRGLAELGGAEVDLVLLGLHLVDGDGFEVFLRTLAARPAAAVAVLAKAEESELAERILRAGARDVLYLDQLEGGALSRLLRELSDHKASRLAATRSEANYRAIFDAVNDAILLLGLESDEILDANAPSELMFGHPVEHLRRMRTADLGSGVAPYTGAEWLAHLQKAALGQPQIFDWQARRSDGSLFWVEMNLKHAPIGGVDRLLAVVRDVTQRKNTESDNERLAAFPRESPFPILECDANGSVIYINPTARKLTERLGVSLTKFLPPNHVDIVRACLNDKQRTEDVETRVVDEIFSWAYQPVVAVGVVHLYALDVTARRAAEERLQRNAMHDVLTGLPNRALLMDRLERNVDLLQRHADYHFAVLLLDLDRFKIINESLGHEIGDMLLREVTQRLNGCVKQSDTVARTGGDEFVLLVEDIGTPGNVTRIADRIQKEMARPFVLQGRDVFVSASIGIIISGADTPEPEKLLQDAETAMYRSKSEGKGRYTVLGEGQQVQAIEALQLETEFRQALERREFVTYYQPILSIHSMAIIGFEALVRWQHPERGLLFPGDFIGLAEETGLIEPMAEQVIEEACIKARDWIRSGHGHLQGSVNLSGLQFKREDLAERILTILVRVGLEPRALKVEVTESVAAGDAEYTIATLTRLRELGIGVMIDDFGTGYSSLAYLKRFPIDFLKIDRTFVMELTTKTEDAAIVTTIILMAHALGFEVVAEGVETVEQLAFLRSHNCDYAQGFLFSKPVPADAFTRLLAEGVPHGAPAHSHI